MRQSLNLACLKARAGLRQQDDEPPVAHAALGDHVVREVAQGAGAPLQHRDLRAVPVVE